LAKASPENHSIGSKYAWTKLDLIFFRKKLGKRDLDFALRNLYAPLYDA
jgi:hypothetical protein